MKNLVFKIAVIITFCLSACSSDILLENPKEIAAETFYNTGDELEAAVFATYQPLRRIYNRMYHTILEAQADYGYGRGSFGFLSEYQGLDAAMVTNMNNLWLYHYQSIRNANLVIKNAPEATNASQVTINESIAEARFMRAFCYFALVRNWGPVPLRTEDNMVDLELARTPVNTIYDLIVSDLEYAEVNLPQSQQLAGRPQKATAKTLLTHVLLQLERWSDARAKALEVINSNTYSLVSVSVPDDFYKIFGPDVNHTSEEIFYLKFNDVYGSDFALLAHHPGSPYLNGNGFFGVYTDSVRNKVIREWDPNDLRKDFMLYNWDIGIGSSTVMLYKKYIDPDAPTRYATNDYNAYRYADLLLYYAEADCKANQGPTADGMEKLNMVHRRAYGYDPNSPSAVDFKLEDYNNESAFLDLILKERGYETMYEGKRYLDLKRTGKLHEIIKEVHNKDIAEKHLLWPIPAVEYDYNNAINPSTDQNPGY